MFHYLVHFCSSFVSNQVPALLLLRHVYMMRQKESSKSKLAVSWDMQVMLLIASVQRVYWSFSPPAIWDVPYSLFSWACYIETLTAPLLWTAVLIFVGKGATHDIDVPRHFQWVTLTVVAFLCGYGWNNFGPYHSHDEEGFPLALEFTLTSHIMDGFAIIPQIYHLASGNSRDDVEDNSAKQALSHFVAILSFGRVFRMVSWVMHLWSLYQMNVLDWSARQRVILFMTPDIIHTVIMGDYMYLWFRAIKERTVDPWLNEMQFLV